MRGRWIRWVAALIAVGTAVRIVLAFASYGVRFDIDSLRLVSDVFRDGPGGLYALGPRWPYPPAFAPVAALCGVVADATGLAFDGVVHLPAIVADAALAALLAAALPPRQAVAGAALVALGPIFALISGHHGQIDAVAILPAVAAAVVWGRGSPGRALQAGLLIGIGAAVKTVPLFVALALLPSVRDRREALTLVAAAVAVPLAALAPWLIRDATQTIDALRENRGVAGIGGLSTFLQPDLSRYYVARAGTPPHPSDAITTFTDLQPYLVALAALAAAAIARRARARPAQAAALVFLAIWAANPNFAYQYLVWGLPFLILAGHLRAAAAVQLAAFGPALLLYTGTAPDLYVVLAIALYAGLVVGAIAYARALLNGTSPAPSPG